MKSRLFKFAGALALLAVLGKYYAIPVMAQARAALIQNLDEPGRNAYVQAVTCFTLTSNQCFAAFNTVPPNMELVVQSVNGSIATNAPNLSIVNLYGSGGFMVVPFQVQGSNSGNDTIYAANQQFSTYYSAGQTPALAININGPVNGTFISSSITLSGYLVNLSQ